jgi:aspartate/methionine/tyrosine aminotransferase
MPIEIEAPEGFGYDKIECNLSESSFADQRLSDLHIDVNKLLLFYGDHKGKIELREEVCKESNLHPDEVLITPGAAAALFMVSTALLDKGDEVLIARSNYATNIETPYAIGANASYLQLKFEEQYNLDADAIEKRITSQTKFVSLTYPHNPTGVMIDADKLKAIINLVEKKGTYLLMDETYREMCFTDKLPVAAGLSDRVISVSSMSKAYGLPGIRVGWILTKNKKLMETFLAAKEQIVITNSVVDEEIAYQYLKQKDRYFAPVKETLSGNFSILKNFMNAQQVLEWVEPQGGCVCFPRIKPGIETDLKKFYDLLLNKYKTYVGRGGWFEEDDRYMRIGYGWEKPDKLSKGLHNILRAIEEARV